MNGSDGDLTVWGDHRWHLIPGAVWRAACKRAEAQGGAAVGAFSYDVF